MLQALQTEKAMFYAEHLHLQEQDRHLLWRRRIHQLDEQTPIVEFNGRMDSSRSKAIDIPYPLPDTGPVSHRRASVSSASGPPRLPQNDFRLSRSAPADLFSARIQLHRSSPANRFVARPNDSDNNDSCVHHACNLCSRGHEDSPHYFGHIAAPENGDLHPFDPLHCQAPIDVAHLPHQPCEPWSCPEWVSAELPNADQIPPAAEHQARLEGLQLNVHSTSSPTTGELTMSSPLASSMLASNMSRQNSTVCSTSLRGAVDVVSFDSNLSNVSNYPRVDYCGDVSTSFSYPSYSATIDSPSFSMESNSSRYLNNHFNFPGEDALSLSAFPYSVVGCSQAGPDLVVGDWDGAFNGVNDAKLDAESHALQPRQDATAYTSRPIAPKGKNGTVVAAKAVASTGPNDVQTNDGKRKLAIAKTPYVRPKYPKKQCDQCAEHPEGFRGEHELRRHMERAHTAVRKMWVCVDPVGNGFLSNCKKCRDNKRYGAYYNAAAHLRRAHFNKRQRGRSRGKSTEKRGGMGGGDQPPMEFLKNWMKEVDDISDGRMSDGSPSPQSDEDMPPEDTSDNLEHLSNGSLDFDCPPVLDQINCRFETSPHEISSFSCRPPFDVYQMEECGGDDSQCFKDEPRPSETRRLTRNQAQSKRRQADFVPRSSYNACCSHPSAVQQPIYSPAFEEEYFPVLQ